MHALDHRLIDLFFLDISEEFRSFWFQLRRFENDAFSELSLESLFQNLARYLHVVVRLNLLIVLSLIKTSRRLDEVIKVKGHGGINGAEVVDLIDFKEYLIVFERVKI